ncbi:MAG: Gfo/Idh/MocA family oxidoreductase [Verrucomicrobia bacterium]|nr:Gfo/Idh/MocA family oxidoreductase [Verrucomicrobiota bacterium]
MKTGVPPALKPFVPSHPLPVVFIGAGGIVRDAHVPAYKKAGFPIAGVYDLDLDRARALADDFHLPRVYDSLEKAVREAPEEAVFDVAVPAAALTDIVSILPENRAVLMQKPVGENFCQAFQIHGLCRRKHLKAAVNFQMRMAPQVLQARSIIDSGEIGELLDVEVRVTVQTPWHRWPFMVEKPYFELPYHSIHHIDLVRSFAGNPERVHALAFARRDEQHFASTIILDYGERLRANIETNHSHHFGLRHQESYVKWEGTRGAVKAQLGLLMNYPQGEPDYIECCRLNDSGEPEDWRTLDCAGSWFPDGFIGTMGSLQQYTLGEKESVPTSIDDALATMAVVEAAIQSNRMRGHSLPLDSTLACGS